MSEAQMDQERTIADVQVGERVAVVARGDFRGFETVFRVTAQHFVTGAAGREERWRRRDGKRTGDAGPWAQTYAVIPCRWHWHEAKRAAARRALDQASDLLVQARYAREFTDAQLAALERARAAAQDLMHEMVETKEPTP